MAGRSQSGCCRRGVAQKRQPELNQTMLSGIRAQWAQRLTDIIKQPEPPARAAIGRALARFDLDQRPGVGLTAYGLPDITWAKIPGGPFRYQDVEALDLPAFYLSRYPVTNRQYLITATPVDSGAPWLGFVVYPSHRRVKARMVRYATKPVGVCNSDPERLHKALVYTTCVTGLHDPSRFAIPGA